MRKAEDVGSELRCSFCNKSHAEVQKLIAGHKDVAICDECVDLCHQIVKGELPKDMSKASPDQQLRQEGFRRVYVWEDGPDALYADHTHPMDTAHIILEGEMTLTCGGSTVTYVAGERPPDVPAGAVHSARMGPKGCRYVIGEK